MSQKSIKLKTSPICKELDRKEDHTALRKAVCKVIDSMDIGFEFTSCELYNLCCRIYPGTQEHLLDTIMRYLRMYRREHVICISRGSSKYRKVEVGNE